MPTPTLDYRLELIEWIDSYGCSSSWTEIAGVDPVRHHCFSVGWIVAENDEAVVIVPHISPKNEVIDARENGCGDMTIPKSAIVTRREVR